MVGPVSSGSFRDIRLFVAAYEERSFTAAARRENATQSGVSQHIRKLEDGLRVKPVRARQGPRGADARRRQLLPALHRAAAHARARPRALCSATARGSRATSSSA